MQIGRLFYAFSLITFGLSTEAYAQQPAAQHSLSVAVGVMDFDLSGTGQTFVAAVRATRALTDHLTVEVGGSFAKPDQQFGPSTFIAPDMHLQYHWQIGRVRPYAGGGVGFAHVRANLAAHATDFTLSGAGGVRIDVSDRFAVLGEMRVRGIEIDFAGSTAEWVGGLTWRLGR